MRGTNSYKFTDLVNISRPYAVNELNQYSSAGSAPEPRAGLRAGHMPGAVSLPFSELLTPEGLMREAEALQAAFVVRGLGPDDTPIASCGSGVTATVPLLALAVLGREGVLYDGSWTEWGNAVRSPVERS